MCLMLVKSLQLEMNRKVGEYKVVLFVSNAVKDLLFKRLTFVKR